MKEKPEEEEIPVLTGITNILTDTRTLSSLRVFFPVTHARGGSEKTS